MLSLSLLTANNWTSKVPQVIKTVIENPTKNQNNLAQYLNKSQSSISESLKRSCFEEIISINEYYKKYTLVKIVLIINCSYFRCFCISPR